MIYSANYLETVKSLTVAQLVLGVVITVLQVITTTFDDNFHQTVTRLTEQYEGFFVYDDVFGDIWSTGIWVGILIIFTASVGMSGYRRNSQALITTHLVFNAFVLLSTLIATIIIMIPLMKLEMCRGAGLSISGYNYQASDKSLLMLTMFGEVFKGSDPTFRCADVMFMLWRAFDGIIMTSYLIEMIITIILIVCNSLAVCRCCRKCCACYLYQNEQTPQMPYRHMPQDAEQAQSMNQSFLQNQMNMQEPPNHQLSGHYITNPPQQLPSAPTAM